MSLLHFLLVCSQHYCVIILQWNLYVMTTQNLHWKWSSGEVVLKMASVQSYDKDEICHCKASLGKGVVSLRKWSSGEVSLYFSWNYIFLLKTPYTWRFHKYLHISGTFLKICRKKLFSIVFSLGILNCDSIFSFLAYFVLLNYCLSSCDF